MQRLNDLLEAERERWFLWLPVGLGIGIAAYFLMPPRFEAMVYAGAAVIALAAAWSMRRRILLLAITLLLLALALLGYARALDRAEAMRAPVLERQFTYVDVEGTVVSLRPYEKGQRLLLEDVSIQYLSPEKTPAMVRLNFKKPITAEPGDRVRLKAGLFPPPEKALPEGFNFRRFFYFQQIGATGYSWMQPEILQPAEPSPLHWLDGIRAHYSARIHAALEQPQSSVAEALMIGEQGAIPEAVKEDMRASGLAHVFSISGLHLSLVAILTYALLRYGLVAVMPRRASRQDLRSWAALGALLFSAAYLALADFPVPAQRAFIMVALVLGAVIFRRRVQPLRSLALAAVIVLVLEPESLLEPSFQLSFAATLAIVALFEEKRINAWLRQAARGIGPKLLAYFLGTLAVSLVAGLATAPFTIYHFQQFPLYTIAANLITSPLVSFVIMPLVVACLILLPLGIAPMGLLGMSIGWMLDVAHWVAGWPAASLHVLPMPGWGLALLSLGGLWWLLWRMRWRWAGAALVAAGFATLLLAQRPVAMLSADGRQMAWASEEGYVMLRGSRRNFIAQQWLEALGEESFLDPVKQLPASLDCDANGCEGRYMNARLLWADSAEMLTRREDGIVLAPALPVRAESNWLTGWDLRRTGAVAYYLEDGSLVQRIANDDADYPWGARGTGRTK